MKTGWIGGLVLVAVVSAALGSFATRGTAAREEEKGATTGAALLRRRDGRPQPARDRQPDRDAVLLHHRQGREDRFRPEAPGQDRPQAGRQGSDQAVGRQAPRSEPAGLHGCPATWPGTSPRTRTSQEKSDDSFRLSIAVLALLWLGAAPGRGDADRGYGCGLQPVHRRARQLLAVLQPLHRRRAVPRTPATTRTPERSRSGSTTYNPYNNTYNHSGSGYNPYTGRSYCRSGSYTP